MNDTLTYQEAVEIYGQIEAAADRSDPDIADLYTDLYARAVRYAGIRAKWQMLSREEKLDQDSGRTSAHNAFITAVNIIARLQQKNAAQNGKNAGDENRPEWRERLGDERKRIGDFACYVALFLAIEAR